MIINIEQRSCSDTPSAACSDLTTLHHTHIAPHHTATPHPRPSQRVSMESQLHETRHALQLELSRARARIQEYEKKDPRARVREAGAGHPEAQRVVLTKVRIACCLYYYHHFYCLFYILIILLFL